MVCAGLAGGAELKTQAAANMLDVVKNVVPSFFVPQNTISDASTIVRAPSLFRRFLGRRRVAFGQCLEDGAVLVLHFAQVIGHGE